MPKISFTFTGQVNNAEITTALDLSTMRNIDVSQMTAKEFLHKINEGDLAISFIDVYAEGDGNVNMDNFEASEDDDE